VIITRRLAGIWLSIVIVVAALYAFALPARFAELEPPRPAVVPGSPLARPAVKSTTSAALVAAPAPRKAMVPGRGSARTRVKTGVVPAAPPPAPRAPQAGPPAGADQRAETGKPRPQSPDEAARFRRLQQQDENGEVRPDGPIRAKQHVDQMRRFQEIASPAGDPSAAGITSSGWNWLGPGNIGGRVRSIVINPVVPSTWFTGGVSGGIWKTVDSGAHWEPVNDFLASLSISTMVIQPGNPSVMYAGTGEHSIGILGAGIFKSTDAGATWGQLPATTGFQYSFVNRLAMSPNGGTLLAGTPAGLYRSLDGGISFSQTALETVGASPVTDVKFDPSDSSRAIASGIRLAWYSVDGGGNWFTAAGLPPLGGRIEVAYARSNPNIVYASVDAAGGTIYKSTNGGATYGVVSTGTNYLGGQGWYDNAIWVDPTNPNTLIVGGIDLWRSTDGGASLTKISNWGWAPESAHADHHVIVEVPGFNGSTNRAVLFGNDGGVYYTSDVSTVGNDPDGHKNGWVSKNNNLGITQYYAAAGNASTGTIVGGTQDNGTLRYTVAGGSQAHTRMFGGDGGYSAADPDDGNYFYGEYQFLGLFRSSNGGEYPEIWFGNAIPDFNGISNFIAPFILDPNNPNTLLAGGASLWRTTNAKFGNPPSFTSIKAPIASFISAIAIAPGDSDICWVGHNNGEVYKSTDCTAAAPTWTQVDTNSPGLPHRMVLRLTVDPSDSSGNRVYATFGGFSFPNAWRTTDGGATWLGVSGGVGLLTALPQVPIHDLEIHPSSSNLLYAATEIGVFTSEDAGMTWQVPQDGPANVIVSELFWMGSDLVAATFGRGLFKATVVAPFGKTFPTNGATDRPVAFGLRWQASSGATSYEYCHDTVNNNTCDTSWLDAGTSTVVGVSGLIRGATYFWQVRARDSVGTIEADNGTWWSVTTTDDVTPPTVISVTPAHGATSVSATTAVTATFSEFVDNDRLVGVPFSAFQLRDPANAVVAATVRLDNISGTHIATLTPSAPLAGSTTYTATISPVMDLAGNLQTSATVWSFTTADTTPPLVIDITPAPGAIGVSLAAVVTATFSEAIDPATLTLVLRNPANVVVPATLSYDAGARVARLTPTGGLAASTTYGAFIAGIRDLTGNDQLANLAWSFTTAGAPVTVGLTTIGSALDTGDSNYLNGSKVTMTAAGQVSSMSVYVGPIDSLVANRQYQLAIYRDNAGRPGTLVAVSATGTLVANTWNALPVSAALLASTNYWLMYNTNGRSAAVNNMRYNPGPAGQGAYSTATVPFGTWPATFPAATITNFVFSLFATLGADITPPTVIATTPASGATGVSTVTDMMAAFSEPIDPATLTTSSFVLRNPAGVSVDAAVGYGEATRVGTLTPSAPLAGLTTYTATISTEVKDVSGNALQNPVVWSFTTAASPPSAFGKHNPANGAVGSVIKPFLGLTWESSTGATSLEYCIDTVPNNVCDGSWVSMNSGAGVALTGLTAGTTYSWQVRARNVAGTTEANGGAWWSFTTNSDATPPTVVSVTPPGGAIGVSRSTAVMVAFSEAIDTEALLFEAVTLRNPANAIVPVALGYNTDTFVVTLTPTAPLAASTTYTVIVTTWVMDRAGNRLLSPVVSSFTTAGADTTPPRVIAVTPPPVATGVPMTTTVTATFSEVLNASSVALVLRNPANAIVPSTVSYNASTSVATLIPAAPLAPFTRYTATIPGSVMDLAGNALGNNFVWWFTTTSAPLTVGLPEIGTNLDSGDSNFLNGSKVTTTSPGQVTSISVYVGTLDALVANRQYQLGIYTDAAGRPGTLVAASTAGTLVANAWNTLSVSASLLGSTNYWLMFNTNGRTGSVNNMRYNSGAAGQGAYSTASVPFGTWPPTFPAATTSNFVYSLFATMSAAAPATAGLTTTGNSLDSGNSNRLSGSRVTMTATGQVTSMSVYVGPVDSLVANRQYQLGIYGEDFGGGPGTFVAASGTGTLVANSWNTLPISASLLGSQTYYLVFNTNGRTTSVNNMYYNTGFAGDGVRSPEPFPFGLWNIFFPAPQGNNFVYSLFATIGGPAPATVGLASIGSSLDSGNSNRLSGSKVTTTAPGQVISMSVYVGPVDSPTANRQYRLGIYQEDLGGGPGTLVAASATGTLNENSWNTLPVSASLLGSKTYYLVFSTTGRTTAVNNMYYNSGLAGDGVRSPELGPLGTFPIFFPAPQPNNFVYSLFATFITDTTPPTVTGMTPANGATGVSRTTAVTAAFGEPIDGATLTTSSFVLRDAAGGAVGATVNYDTANGIGTLTPSAPLAASTTYTVTVTAVKDLAGNQLAGPVVWSFTTAGPADTTPPTVTSVTPANGATGVILPTAVAVTFSEPIDPSTLTTSTFTLRTPAGVVPATISYNVGTRVATLTPLATLATATTYTATVTTGVTDVAGNHLVNTFVASFTTAGTPLTLGLTTIGSSLDSGDRHYMNGSKVTTTDAGQISSMSVYVGAIDSLAANRQYQLAVYTDNAGRPGTLIAASAAGTLVANAWNALPVSASLLGSTNYWLMFNTNGRTEGVNNMRYNSGAAGQGAYSTGSVTFGTWPATFPAATATNFVFSLFATFGP
jgi:hypothetical protein